VGRGSIASGKPGDNLIHAGQSLEYSFSAPKATAREYGSLFALCGAIRIDGGIGKRRGRFCQTQAGKKRNPNDCMK
jgi:hypothetical protein